MDVRPSLLVPGALGAFATKSVAAGETIVAESADFLSAPRVAVSNREHNDRFAWSMLDALLPTLDAQTFYDSLLADRYASGIANHTWESGDGRVLETLAAKHKLPAALVCSLYDILGTNALTASIVRRPIGPSTVLEKANQYGFYRLLSRVNHSCEPNAAPVPSQRDDGVLPLVATRAIAANEEITINYMGEQRQSRAEIFRMFGFRCACPACKRICGWIECSATVLRPCPCHLIAYCCVDHQCKDWKRHRSAEHVNKTQ